jgi:hypothetical protein
VAYFGSDTDPDIFEIRLQVFERHGKSLELKSDDNREIPIVLGFVVLCNSLLREQKQK